MKRKELKNAVLIGVICIFTYLACYYLRNVLSVFTPQMKDTEFFTESSLAMLSSIYMIAYAAGQLVNGVLGDIIKQKYMVMIGLTVAGAAMIIFPTNHIYAVSAVCFALLGVGLSMLRGPLVKVISENTLPDYARIICVLLSFVSFLGPFVAGLFAIWMQWETAFTVSGIISVAMALLSFGLLSVLEKKGIVKPIEIKQIEKRKIDIIGVFKIERFIPFLFIGMIVEISATSIAFWIPTYITDYLTFPEKSAGVLFSAVSLVKSFSPFLCLFLIKLFKENDVKLMRVMFAVSAGLYAAMFFVAQPWVNIILFMFAIMSTSIASSTIWSIYIPGLGKSGKVSSANGVMDCSGYIGAAVMNSVFAIVKTSFDWKGMIIAWMGVMIAGILLTFFAAKKETSGNIQPGEQLPPSENTNQ